MKHMFESDIIESEKDAINKKHRMTKADICLLSGMAVAALFLFLFFRLQSVAGSYMEISCDGVLLLQEPLFGQEAGYYLLVEDRGTKAEDGLEQIGVMQMKLIELPEAEWEESAEQIIAEYQSDAYNILLCQDGVVRMIQSSCPDQICVHHKAVSTVGENIICLPHKIVVEITGDEASALDGVVY